MVGSVDVSSQNSRRATSPSEEKNTQTPQPILESVSLVDHWLCMNTSTSDRYLRDSKICDILTSLWYPWCGYHTPQYKCRQSHKNRRSHRTDHRVVWIVSCNAFCMMNRWADISNTGHVPPDSKDRDHFIPGQCDHANDRLSWSSDHTTSPQWQKNSIIWRVSLSTGYMTYSERKDSSTLFA